MYTLFFAVTCIVVLLLATAIAVAAEFAIVAVDKERIKFAANNKKEEHSARENNNSTASGKQETETDIPTVDMRKKIPLRSYKVNGYRVQVFAGGNSRNDRLKAERIGNAIKMRYPDQPVYVHFYSPRWICRVGNFRSLEEARKMLAKVKAMGYRQACLVKGKITVQY